MKQLLTGFLARYIAIAVSEEIGEFPVEHSIRFNMIAYGSEEKWCDDLLSNIFNPKSS